MNKAGHGLSGPNPATVAIRALADWLAASEDTPWIVETSGSTGRPKRVMLSRAAVRASIELSGRRLGATGRWLLALPASYVAGVNVITRSLSAGEAPVLLDDAGSFADATDALGPGPRFVSLVPTQLTRLLQTDVAALASYHTVLLGGGPIDASLRTRAADAGVHVVATYGSAETCGGVVYDGLPFDGVGLALGSDARVRLSGPTLFSGYQDDPALSAEALVDGWFLTSDAGRLDEDGRLRLLGRIDDMVVTGGVNVPAAVVARRLREHPAIAGAEAIGVPDEEWGSRLVAVVVRAHGRPHDEPVRHPEPVPDAEHGEAFDLDELRDWVAAVHPRAWAPREVVVVEEIPMLPNGKTDRLALQRIVGERR